VNISKNFIFIFLSTILSVSLVIIQNGYSEEVNGGLLSKLVKNNDEKSINALKDINVTEAARTASSNVRNTAGTPAAVVCLIDPIDGSLARISLGSYFGTSYSVHGFWDIPAGLPACNGFAFVPIHGTAVLSSNLQNVSLSFAATCVDPNWAGGHFHFNFDLFTGIGTGFTINNETGEKFSGSFHFATCPF
jgi:hypothetical protein